MIYLDNAATSPLLPCAKRAMENAPFGNPSSAHKAGKAARGAIEEARAVIAKCIDCEPDEVYFTSGATESCNTIMCGFGDYFHDPALLGSPFEHSAIYESGAYIYSDEPEVHILANNENGEVYDIKNKCLRIIATDATAAIGHIPVSFKDLGVDLMAFGAHKFGGPMGTGCLVVKRYVLDNPYPTYDTPFDSFIDGGGQERGMRGGTESVPLILGMAAALEQRCDRIHENAKCVCAMRDELIHRLLQIPGCHVNGPWEIGNTETRLPGNVNVRFDGVSGSALVMRLSERDICISTGSACNSGSEQPSRVLMATGLTAEQALSSVRITIDIQNELWEILRTAKEIREIVEDMRK